MIPKLIHYCWFGKKEKPFLVKYYIKSWRDAMPDYELMEWNEENSPLNANDFVKEAFASKKYAFVSDYVRMYALYKYGGIYLDTDILALKSFDPFLTDKAFCCFETLNNYIIGTAVIGCEAKNEVVASFLEYYSKRHFINNGNYDIMANTFIFRFLLEPFGLVCNNIKQELSNGFVIYPRTFFSAKINSKNKLDITKETVCVHNFAESWISPRRKFNKTILNTISYFKIRRIMKKWGNYISVN